MQITQEALKRLRSRLPSGYQRLTHERLRGQYTMSHISMVANGKRNNATILKALIRVAEQHEQARAAMEAAAIGN